MSYRWVDHTAELELALECASEARVFEDALRALAELLGGAGGGDEVRCEIALEAPDRAALLAAWLDELVFCAETGDLVPDGVESLELDRAGLRARVRAHRGNPRHIVKAVTYHGLTFGRDADGRWRATLVLDV